MASTERLESARRLLASGCWQQAEAAAQAALAAEPDDSEAALLTGLAVAAMGEADRAAPMLVRAAARPDAAHPCLDLAALAPPVPQALVMRQFRACLALSPADNRLRRIFAEYLLDLDDYEAAESILAAMPGDAAAHH